MDTRLINYRNDTEHQGFLETWTDLLINLETGLADSDKGVAVTGPQQVLSHPSQDHRDLLAQCL